MEEETSILYHWLLEDFESIKILFQKYEQTKCIIMQLEERIRELEENAKDRSDKKNSGKVA